MLPNCYQNVRECYQRVTNMLPTCYQDSDIHVTKLLPNCYQNVTKCYQIASIVLSTCYPNVINELPPGFPHPRVPRPEFAPWVPPLGPSLSSPPLGSRPLGTPPDGHPLDPHGTLPTHIHVPATSGAMARFGEPYVSNVRGLALLCMMGNVACRTDAISYNHGRADVVGVGTFCTRWCGGRGVLCDAGCCCVLGERFFLF